ncbi:MAG TPA: hypothetical protein VFS92_06475, partial [Planctomycetota bacterium]|nr:hypothetical protein [Planctomycetota bacterium]
MAPAFAPVDRRKHLDGLRASLRADVRSMRAVQVRAGRTLLEIRRAGDPLFFAATTFPIFCESAGLSPAEARDLTAMAEAAEAWPQVAARVLAARITPQKAAVVQQLLRSPELQRPGEDVLGLVESLCARDLIREVKRRKEQARLGE